MDESSFIGRSAELDLLNDAWSSDRFELVILYGRKRIGKTTLLSVFSEGKPTVYHSGQLGARGPEMDNLFQAISVGTLGDVGISFDSLTASFHFLGERAKNERLLFIIDEFPNFAQTITEAMSALQHAIDHQFGETKLMIILSGSSVSFMENEVLGHKSPLYGRRTLTLQLGPLSLAETAQLCKRTPADSVAVHAMTGGIPFYVRAFSNPNESLASAIEEVWFTPDGLLYQEPQFFLALETRKSDQYLQLLTYLAGGANKANQLAAKMQISSAHLAALLSTLKTLGIVTKEHPFGNKGKQSGIWTISDSLFAFHLRFVYPFIGKLEQGRNESAVSILKEDLSSFIGRRFKEMCLQYFLQTTELAITSVGRWWGSASEEEIDFVAQDSEGTMVFGECKLTNTNVGMGEFETLKRRSMLVNNTAKREFWLFSKSGFTDELIRSKSARLVSLDEMVVQ